MSKTSNQDLFRKLSNNRLFRLYLMYRLPLTYLAGIKMVSFRRDSATISMRYKWINTNPFKSMYFAAMNMGAEMSSGLLLFAHIKEVSPKVSMLLEEFTSKYSKKVVGKVLFICQEGDELRNAAQIASESTDIQKITTKVYATDEMGTILATFELKWSLKNLAESNFSDKQSSSTERTRPQSSH
jgi:hypothetical protein